MLHIDTFSSDDAGGMAAFVKFQKILYENDPYFIPDETVVLPGIQSGYFLARQEKKICGRAAGLINPLLTYRDRPAGMIGFFECIEDPEAAKALFQAVGEWLQRRQCSWCIGPMNGSTWHKYRVTLPDPSPPFFLDNIHKPWYQSLFEGAGFSAAERYVSTRIRLTASSGAGHGAFEPVLKERGLRVRPIRMDDFEKEIRAIYDLSVEAFSKNVLYTPISWDDFFQLYRKAAGFVDPAYVRLCEDAAGRLQGFIFAVEDRFQPPSTALIIKTLAVRPGLKAKGLGSYLVRRLHRDARKAGYRSIIHALMHEKNVSTRVADAGSERLRQYHLYARQTDKEIQMNRTEDNPFLTILFDHAEKKGTHPALRHKGRTMTYEKLAEAVCETAGGLARCGIGKGDRVLIFVPMSIRLYVLLLAVWHRGAAAVFLDAWADRRRLEQAIALADCKAFIGIFKTHLFRLVSPALRSVPVKLFPGLIRPGTPPQVTPAAVGQTALLTFTTGSTGTPKAADRTFAFLLAQHQALQHHLAPRDDEIDLTALPVFVLTNIASGITSVIPDMDHRRPERIDPAVLLRELDTERVTRACGSPVLFDRLARYCEKTGKTPRTLQRIFLGGAPVFPEPAQRLVRVFPDAEIEIVFGSTEAEPISRINAARVARSRILSPDQGLPVGQPVDETDCRIIAIQAGPVEVTGADGLDKITLPADSVGEICVSGNHVLKGYFKNPEAMRENKIQAGDAIWHRTGDAGYIDAQGDLFLMGRVESRFERKGRRYFVFPLESMLARVPGITLATYLMSEDRLILACEGTAAETEILQSIEDSPLPRPDQILRIQIPRDPRHNSKIDYGKLRDRISGAA